MLQVYLFWYEFSRSEHVKIYLESRTLALHYWMENPIIGLGEGGFWLKPDGGIHAHSTYFTILVNRGLIGVILFLSFSFHFTFYSKKESYLI